MNYKELQQLHEAHRNTGKGLMILGFPCNNFGAQEPGSNAEIQAFAAKKGATFTILGKVECENMPKTHPLWTYLRASVPAGILGQSIKWNFTKWACNAEGVPVHRFGPTDNPLSFKSKIVHLLGDSNHSSESKGQKK